MKDIDPKIKTISLNAGIVLGTIAFIAFLYFTNQLFNPLIIFIIGLFIVTPFRRESYFIRRLILLFGAFFVLWIFSVIGSSIAPFAISFVVAYLLDPFVGLLEKKKIPRWLSSFVIILVLIGIVTTTFVLISPMIFSQFNEITQKVATVVTTFTSYLETQKVSKILDDFGIRNEYIKNLIETEFIPELKYFISKVINSLGDVISGISSIAKQVINAVLIPIFSFYFLKDFRRFKEFFRAILLKKNQKLLYDLQRINSIFRIYISWQVFAAFLVATLCSVSFTVFNVEFSLILGILCGFLNPIPYLGLISSLILSVLTILLIAPPNMFYQIIVVVSTILAVHFINAYIIEPNVLGHKVGLHPVILILSLYVFGGLFGLIGLLFAVPTTAALMLFLNDWTEKLGIHSK